MSNNLDLTTQEGRKHVAKMFFEEMNALEEKYKEICEGEFSPCWDDCVIVLDDMFQGNDFR